MANGKHLKVVRFGDDRQGVTITGDRNNPEPSTFTLDFPGGQVELQRRSDDTYWIGISVRRSAVDSSGDKFAGRVLDARIDIEGQHTSLVDVGDLANPGFLRAAFHVTTARETEQ